MSIPSVLLIAFLSYVLGLLLDTVCWHLWYRRFRIADMETIAFERFSKLHPELTIRFRPVDWPILKAFIHRHDRDWAAQVDQFNAMTIMLRNLSLGLALLCLWLTIEGITTDPIYLLGVVFCAGLSFVAGKKTKQMKLWFFSSIYESIVAYGLSSSDLFGRATELGAGSEVSSANHPQRPDLVVPESPHKRGAKRS